MWLLLNVSDYDIDVLVQDCSNSIANALELLQSCTKPSICFYPRPFWPTGIVIACVCVCVYLCVCRRLPVRAITHHTFQLESPDLDEKMQNILLKDPIVLGADWAWPSMSNLTSFQDSVYLHRFCVFEIFVRCAKTEFVELFHIAHGAAHILIPLYARRQGRAMDRETV